MRSQLPAGTEFDPERSVLEITHSKGIFSNASITLSALGAVHPRGQYVKVNWSKQDQWRDNDRNQANLFDDYFAPNQSANPALFTALPPVVHHGIYEDLHFRALRPYVAEYFRQAPIVQARMEAFIRKYDIDFDKIAGLCHRGTDKWIEIPAIGTGYYFGEARKLLRRHPDMRLLIQTDQRQVRDECIRDFGDRAFFIEEMPVTESNCVMHEIPPRSESFPISNWV